MSYFVNIEEVRDSIYKAFDSEIYLRTLDQESEAFERGAEFGMLQAYTAIASQCKRYELKEKNMKVKMDLDNREIEITEEELDKLKLSKRKTGYERAGDGHTYNYVNTWGEVMTIDDEGSDDDLSYKIANYHSDFSIAENNARADKLMRQLRRFAVEHRKKEINFNDNNQRKYYIYCENVVNNLNIAYCYSIRYFGAIYFDSPESAQLAIDTFHDELVWYFTEYKDSI